MRETRPLPTADRNTCLSDAFFTMLVANPGAINTLPELTTVQTGNKEILRPRGSDTTWSGGKYQAGGGFYILPSSSGG